MEYYTIMNTSKLTFSHIFLIYFFATLIIFSIIIFQNFYNQLNTYKTYDYQITHNGACKKIITPTLTRLISQINMNYKSRDMNGLIVKMSYNNFDMGGDTNKFVFVSLHIKNASLEQSNKIATDFSAQMKLLINDLSYGDNGCEITLSPLNLNLLDN